MTPPSFFSRVVKYPKSPGLARRLTPRFAFLIVPLRSFLEPQLFDELVKGSAVNRAELLHSAGDATGAHEWYEGRAPASLRELKARPAHAAETWYVGRTDAMSWELDHVFFASMDAEAAEAELTAFGFTFAVRRVHPGQGTANACAVFENAFFEVLRAHDSDELDSDLVRPLGLRERIRWRETGACPFGLCFRPTHTPTDPETWPFETWQYAPPYVPTGSSIPIVTPRYALSEPLVFILNRPKPSPDAPLTSGAKHGGAHRTLTHVEVHRPRPSADSPGVLWFAQHHFFSLNDSPEFRLDLQWDRGRDALTHTFGRRLPIAVCS